MMGIPFFFARFTVMNKKFVIAILIIIGVLAAVIAIVSILAQTPMPI